MCSHFEVYGSHDYLEMAPSCSLSSRDYKSCSNSLPHGRPQTIHKGHSLTSAASVLQLCCKWEEKAVWKNLLLQSTLVSQTISLPFRRQIGSLWILDGRNLTYLDRFNVWWEARWESRCVVSDTILQLKVLNMCVISNTETSWVLDVCFFSQFLWTSISFSIMVPWQWSVIWQPPASPKIPTLSVELPPYSSNETGSMLKMVQSTGS